MDAEHTALAKLVEASRKQAIAEESFSEQSRALIVQARENLETLKQAQAKIIELERILEEARVNGLCHQCKCALDTQ
jgi:hypothetical protein